MLRDKPPPLGIFSILEEFAPIWLMISPGSRPWRLRCVCVCRRGSGGGARGPCPPPPPHKRLLPQIVRRGSRGGKRALPPPPGGQEGLAPPPYKILDPPMVCVCVCRFVCACVGLCVCVWGCACVGGWGLSRTGAVVVLQCDYLKSTDYVPYRS